MLHKEQDKATPQQECPNCGKPSVSTVIETQRLTYGNGEEAAEISVEVPVRTCTLCGFQYTDEEAEDVRHEAVCRHLGLMTPKQIVALRKQCDMSRAEFAELTRFGEASLARWETGQLIQNAANDQLLYLLTFESNVKLLRERDRRPHEIRPAADVPVPYSVRFGYLTDVEAIRSQARAFCLRSAAIM